MPPSNSSPPNPFKQLLPLPLFLFLCSTPCACVAIHLFAANAPACQIVNNYAFASGMLLLYLLPLFSPLRQHCLGFQRRLHEGVLVVVCLDCNDA